MRFSFSFSIYLYTPISLDQCHVWFNLYGLGPAKEEKNFKIKIYVFSGLKSAIFCTEMYLKVLHDHGIYVHNTNTLHIIMCQIYYGVLCSCKNQTYHPMSSNYHPTATINKAENWLWLKGVTKPTGTSYNLDNVWSGAPDGPFWKNYSSSGMLYCKQTSK